MELFEGLSPTRQANARATHLFSLYESNAVNDRLNIKFLEEMLVYMKAVPAGERAEVLRLLQTMLPDKAHEVQ